MHQEPLPIDRLQLHIADPPIDERGEVEARVPVRREGRVCRCWRGRDGRGAEESGELGVWVAVWVSVGGVLVGLVGLHDER